MTHKIGIVGVGTIAFNRHIPAYLRSNIVELEGVYDRNAKALDKAKREYGIDAYDSIESLCRVVDTVAICTPPWTHRDLALKIFEHGCHVFTEKPMAMSIAEAQEMINAADSYDRQLAVVHNNLWKRSVTKGVKRIKSGELGDVRRTHAIQLREMDDWNRHSQEWFDRLPGGLFWDEAPHMIYLTRQFLGDTEVVDATADRRESRKQQETAIRARFKGENNKNGALTMLFDAPITEWWFFVVCSRGLVAIDIFRNTVVVLEKEKNHSALRVLMSFLSFVTQTGAGILRTGFAYLRDRTQHDYVVPDAGFSQQVEETIRAFNANSNPPVSGEDGLKTVRVMQQIATVGGMK